MRATDEHVHDGKALPELVDHMTKPNKKQQFANCLLMVPMMAMIFLDIYRTIKFHPALKQEKTQEIKFKTNHVLRNLSVLAQRNGLQRWTDSVSYGHRWTAKTVFSSIKRTFDIEYVFILSCLKYGTGNDAKSVTAQQNSIWLGKAYSKIWDFKNHATKQIRPLFEFHPL